MTRRTAAFATLACAALLLAGCSDPSSGSEADPQDGGTPPLGVSTPDEEPAAPLDNGTMRPPVWAVGDSWTWRLENLAAGWSGEATTVVRAASADSYEVGAKDARAAAQVFPYHLVGLGTVNAANLAWDAHGTQVAFLRFPLEDGATWTSDFWAAPGATVTLDATTAEGPDGPEPVFRSNVSFPDGGGLLASAYYAPARGQFVRAETYFGAPEPFAVATLLSSARNETTSQAFLAHELFRVPVSSGAPETMTPRTVDVPADAQLLLLACFLPGDEGAYHVAFAPPAGAPAVCGTTNTAAGSRHYTATVLDATPGQATVSFLAAGEATANVEAFAIATG